MKLVIAIIQPGKLEEVKAALTEVDVFRLTVMDCQGFGRQKGKSELYRGREFSVNLTRKVQLQIAVNDEFVEPTVDAIIRAGRSGDSGEIGDGKIFILPMDDCVRIRTGERGPEADALRHTIVSLHTESSVEYDPLHPVMHAVWSQSNVRTQMMHTIP